MSRTIDLAKELEYQTLKALSVNGGELSTVRLKEILKEKVELDDWAKGVYEKTGYIRWESTLQFYSIDLVKAGFITKKNSTWYITEEGEKAIKWGKDKLFEEAQKKIQAMEGRLCTRLPRRNNRCKRRANRRKFSNDSICFRRCKK